MLRMPEIKKNKKKELHVASNLGDLNKQTEISRSYPNPSQALKAASKLLKEAELNESLGDEEIAYVLYMRYFNLISRIKKTSEYKKDESYFNDLIGSKNSNKAIRQAECLQKSLRDRYDFLKAQAYSEKLDSMSKSSSSSSSKSDVSPGKDEKLEASLPANDVADSNMQPSADKPNGTSKVAPAEPYNSGYISALELYALFHDSQTNLVVMDTRSAEDYADSRLVFPVVINVPSEIIPPGTTVPYIEKELPNESRKLWKERAEKDYIILMDWNSTLDKLQPGTVLKTLKDALFKFDSSVILQKEPLILQGGYSQWMLYYPQTTTCPLDLKKSLADTSSTSPSLDFDYPELDLVLQSVGSKTTANLDIHNNLHLETDPTSNGETAKTSGQLPPVDRALKPKFWIAGPKDPQTLETASGNSQSYTGQGAKLNNYYVSGQVVSDITAGKVKDADISSALQKLSLHETTAAAKNNIMPQDGKLPKVLNTLDKDELLRLSQKEQSLIEKQRLQKEEERRYLELLKDRKIQEDSLKLMKQQHKKLAEEIENLKEAAKAEQEETERLRLLREKEMRNVSQIPVEDKGANVSPKHEANSNLGGSAAGDKPASKKPVAVVKPKEDHTSEERVRIEKPKAEWERLANLDKLKAEEEAEAVQQALLKAKEQRQDQEELADKQALEQEAKAAQAKKEAEEKLRRINDSMNKPKLIPSPTLPAGWEKRLDPKTNRYFYINHITGTTTWNPPQLPVSVLGTPASQKSVYKMKLKDDSSSSSSGLKRSHSSPNIAQLVENEGKEKLKPQVDRSTKPISRLDGARQALHSKPNPSQVRVRNLNPVFGTVHQGLTGLRNIGNTCYMNSIIQCLSNTFALVKYFLNDSYLCDVNRNSVLGDRGEVVDEFAVILKALWNGQYKCITPRDFKNTVGKYAPMFAGFDQHDSQEFLTFLLDQLHEGLNKVTERVPVLEQDNENIPEEIAAVTAWESYKKLNKSIIVELFQGQLKSTLRCLTCQKISVTFQTFQYLSLPIPSSTKCKLQDCLELFVKEERMTGDCQWKCPRCKRQRDAVKKMDIWKLPHILLIGLSRFSHEGVWRHKLNTYVDFPTDTLDISSYVKGSKPKINYQLYAVSNHYGSMKGGHYTSFCKNPIMKKWHKFDDHEIYEMSRSDVKTSAAFVLFYSSIDIP